MPEPMDRRSIRIEIPLPRKPTLRKLRFSLKSLAVFVALIAAGQAIFNYAAESERSKYRGGYITYVISKPTSFDQRSVPRNQYPDIRSFIKSKGNSIEQWPPTIWIKRVDLRAPELEKRIDISCGGTLEDPTFHGETVLQPRDIVFIDFGRMKTKADVLQDIAKVHGVALDAPTPESPKPESPTPKLADPRP